MVATPTGTAPQAQPARVAAFPARHGRHAAWAAQEPWRALQPDNVRELRTLADADPRGWRSKLPRWHKTSAHRELTSGLYAMTGKAWVWRYDPATGRREPVREGTTNRTTWLSRDRFLNGVVPLVLAEPGARETLRAHKVDRDTFRRFIRHETLYADQRTGRRVIVRAKTIAALMEVCERTVKRCRSAARELGLYATVYPGRMLKQLEQVQARYKGSAQRGLAAESAFIVPRSVGVKGSVSCLHRGVRTGHFPTDGSSLVTLNTDGEKEATPSPLTKKRKRRASPGYQLARAVVERLPFARNADPSRLAGMLHRFATSSTPWTAQDVVQHVDAVNARRGWSSITSPLELKAPAHGLLASYLRDTDPNADHPRLDVFLADQRRADQLADRRRIDQEIRDGIRCCRHC